MQEEDALIRNKQEEIHLSIASEKQKTDELLATMDKDLLHELSGKGVDTERITALRNEVARTEQELVFIDQHRRLVYDYREGTERFFDRRDEFRNERRCRERTGRRERKVPFERGRIESESNGTDKQLAETNTRLKLWNE